MCGAAALSRDPRFAPHDQPKPLRTGRRQIRRWGINQVRQIGLTPPPGMSLLISQARRGNRFQDVDHQSLGPETLGKNRKPIAPEPRAIAAGEADHHERVVAKAERRAHGNRMGTSAQTSRSDANGVAAGRAGLDATDNFM